MSWQETLQEVVRKYYRAGAVDPPPWVTGGVGPVSEPVTLSNATCGDRVVVYLDYNANVPDDPLRIWLDVAGCAICKASAEMVVRSGTTLPPDEFEALVREVLVGMEGSPDWQDSSGGVATRGATGVPREDITTMLKLREVPGRSRCASLPWDAVLQALESSR